uniref:PDZ domain-containing protein n=1 Tax=Gopherus agassizii TaxID=38772 RepID=A0A452H3V8_9SAUR
QDFRTSRTHRICLLQDGNQEPFKVRLHLAKDILMIQEQDVICVSGEPFYSGERTVTIRRQTVGGFGLSIKGGAEHNIPVVISKISKEQRAELSGLLFIGDAILQINGINVRKCRHEEVVQVLRNAGEEVTLTVSFLKRAPAFLKLPLNEDCACVPSDQSSGTSSPLCDSGLHLNYHPNNTDTLSCSSWPTSPGLRWEKRWCDLRLIPLLHSRFSQYLPGSDLCRQNAFQVIAVDGVCSGIIQSVSAEDCMDWLQAIATNISNLTKHNVSIDQNLVKFTTVSQFIQCVETVILHTFQVNLTRCHIPVKLLPSCRGRMALWLRHWTRIQKILSELFQVVCLCLKFY